jgi:hypothetical protein
MLDGGIVKVNPLFTHPPVVSIFDTHDTLNSAHSLRFPALIAKAEKIFHDEM